jgi:RNA polymerase sigma factor for flagellar operon FliA
MTTIAVHMGDTAQKAAIRPGVGADQFENDVSCQAVRTSRSGVLHRDDSCLVDFAPSTDRSDSPAPSDPRRCAAEIDERIRLQVSLVGMLVSERMRTLPSHVMRDDLMSAGMTALVLSARAFDPTLGVPFPVFASYRIRGALLDELRSMDWTSRNLRARARDMDLIVAELTAALARQPRTDEIAAAMGIAVKEVERVHANIARGPVLSLHSSTADAMPAHSHSRVVCPESLILQRERMGYLHDAIAALPARLRLVVVAYYFEQRQMIDIAAELSVTQSRVSQLCTEALMMLRDGMNSQLDPDALPTPASTGRAAATRRAYYQAMADRNTVAGRLAMSNSQGEMRSGIAVGHSPAFQNALAG